MSSATASTTIDVRDIAPRERQHSVFAAYRALALGGALEIVNDRDLKPLYHRFQTEAPGNFSWVCLQSGPQLWRVSVQKLTRSHSAGECCGVCCSGPGRLDA